jgi:glycosyltransferase involved in cell wall biosynthesis
MDLDVVIPTYNREDMLQLTLESLLRAKIPMGLQVLVTVVDNNSKDNTRFLIQRYQEKFQGRFSYQFESRQGRSHALNAGIASTRGDLVGIIDDDEEIDEAWYTTIYKAFMVEGIDFVGGPYVPRWRIPPPEWLPPEYGSVVGWVDGGDVELPFDHNYPGILMGGNAVFKRSILEKVGPYSTWLGRTDKGLLSGEDEDLYDRLLSAGARGTYLPSLIIYHHVTPERLTKSYFRRWCFWRGVSLGSLDQTRKLPCPYLLGIPRWHYRKAAKGVLSTIINLILPKNDQARAFASELAIWDCLGLLYGRHFRKVRAERTNQFSEDSRYQV